MEKKTKEDDQMSMASSVVMCGSFCVTLIGTLWLDSDMGFALKVMAIGMSPMILNCVLCGIGRVLKGIRQLCHRYWQWCLEHPAGGYYE